MAILGAGQVGQAVAAGLRARGVPVVCFVDESAARPGRRMQGIDVVCLDEATRRLKGAGCIVCAFYLPHASLAAACARVTAQSGVEAFAFLPLIRELPGWPHYCFDADATRAHARVEHAQWLFERLSDDASRQVLESELRLRIELEPISTYVPSPPMSGVALWPPNRERLDFVDCGAYDGDTLAAFVEWSGGNYRRIHALEPDPDNYHRLQARVRAMPEADSARIVTYPLGVSDRPGRACFAGTGTTASCLDRAGDTMVELVALDDLLAPDGHYLIKLDVEGVESRALQGARRTLAAGRSGVAVSLYHRPQDIVELPLMVDALLPEATFFLRSHGFDGADLTLYAFPPET